MNRAIKYGIIISGIIILALIPGKLIFNDAPLCIFNYLTGIECPLCGMTRACYSIMHLQALNAFSYNPASLILPVLLLSETAFDFFPSKRTEKIRKSVLYFFLISMVLLFIFRIIRHFI